MAVAAYASLVSLIHVLDNLQHPARLRRLHVDRKQIEALQENVHHMLDFVEVHSERKGQEIEGLWRQISEVADEAEDVIDLHVVNQLQHGSRADNGDSELSSFCEDMERVIQKTDSIKKDLLMVEEVHEDVQTGKQPKVSVPPAPAASSVMSSGGRNTTVGFDEHVVKIVDLLTRDEPNLRIIPITGMGGIGKTTLARNVFEHPYIVNHFYTCIWLTISQEYSVKQILLGLLGEGGKDNTGEDLVELGQRMHKKLYVERYLIVLDDVWSAKAWDDLKIFFPKNNKRSRIIITTRLSNVAVSLSSEDPYMLSFLSNEESLNLLSHTVFGQEGYPCSDLEKIGKDIAKSCRGLPLAIVVIGRLLANSNMSPEHWKFVANNINSFGNLGDDEHCLKILSLSYDNLPIHLKPCFIHMRVFPEDHKISVSNLIKLWLAKGFIKPVCGKSLEEVAEAYVKDLVDRSLIFIRENTTFGKIKTCGIHDLLRDLCFKEANKEHFVHTPRIQFFHGEESVCFLCGDPITKKEVDLDPQYTPEVCLSRCDACEMMYSRLRLARVININNYDEGSREECEQPTKIRFLSVVSNEVEFGPSALHLLWNLQTLIIDAWHWSTKIVLPHEIWEMPQLRHIDVTTAILPDPVGEDFIILENLQTLSRIKNFPCTNAVVDRIPNVKNLKVEYEIELEDGVEWCCRSLYDLAQLHNLESLSVERAPPKLINFPSSLKTLVLTGCLIPWNDMTIIGSLPNLEELELRFSMEGPEWNPVEGEFQKLKVLDIGYNNDLVWWRADETHFPKLESLTVHSMLSLQEIPLGFAYIDTLHAITLYWCSDSAINSAKQIWEEQQEMGNDSLRLHISEKSGKEYQLGGGEVTTNRRW